MVRRASEVSEEALALARRQRCKQRFKKIKVKLLVMKAFDDAGQSGRRKRAGSGTRASRGSREFAPPDIDEFAESKIVGAARARMSAVPGPRVDAAGFHYASAGLQALRFAASSVQDPRKHTLVTQHIVLGCREDAMDLVKLRALGVTHVLNTSKQLPNFHEAHLVYHKIPLLDAPGEHIVECCDVATAFLQRVERVGGRALVHCIAGASRSVSVVLMHLMLAHRVSLRDAFQHINRMRPQADPNEGFKLQLALLEVRIFGASSVAGRDASSHWGFYEWNVRKAHVARMPPRRNRPSAGGDSAACAIQ
ncbi:protein-tyrosine phosphatase-like protein [Pelagophyceae sp. CCMP2097]|nr:protein-tyrosine phosphatase-like protein [Pelagophyceae sp. CCMP2097]|mmetsp:Transcript_3635/g.11054  ORF Transcript_3635/g.11054 Transcript_3635/m.11054 type:complete len:308 (+) Transcript_3635:47-970(+)